MRKSSRSIIIILLVTIGMLASVEIIARVLTWHKPEQTIYTHARYGFYPDGFGDLYPQDSVWTIWKLRPYNVYTNSVGLRNIDELEPDAYRILAVGDSFTFGPYVANADTWPAQLEAELHSRDPLRPVQVLNAGIAGYTIADELAYLQDKGFQLNPDMVIIAIYANDVSDYRTQKRQEFARPDSDSAAVVNSNVTQSATYTLLMNLIGRLNSTPSTQTETGEIAKTEEAVTHFDVLYSEGDYQEYWDSYRQDLTATITLLAEHSIPLVLVVVPEYFQLPENAYPPTIQDFIADIALEYDLPYIDLLPAFRAVGGDIEGLYLLRYDSTVVPVEDFRWPDRERYVGNGHLSRYGYLVSARAIADTVMPMLP